MMTDFADVMLENYRNDHKYVQARMLDSMFKLMDGQSERIYFQHSILCQLGLPRDKMDSREFERRSGNAVLKISAGELFDGKEFVEQPLPYGSKPRLVLTHISSEAIRTQEKVIEVGRSTRDFLKILGCDTNGRAYNEFKKQMRALAACRLTLGMKIHDRAITVDAKPVTQFDAWYTTDNTQLSFWPGTITLSQDFFDTLAEHAVPLDMNALAGIQNSCLSIDIYTWLAYRLCRINKHESLFLSWMNLKDQFGMEYISIKNFKKEFSHKLERVLKVYSDAKIESVEGGLLFRSSPPPIKKIQTGGGLISN
jgi:hypothetical protein